MMRRGRSLNLIREEQGLKKSDVTDAWKDQTFLSHIRHSSQRCNILRLLGKHKSMFSEKLRTVDAITKHIELKPGTAPIRQQPYRAGPGKREQIREQLSHQLATANRSASRLRSSSLPE